MVEQNATMSHSGVRGATMLHLEQDCTAQAYLQVLSKCFYSRVRF